ncbi:MAG TPA: lipocalin-like domain-containing protein, partial [Anaeromyxobacter sp.]
MSARRRFPFPVSRFPALAAVLFLLAASPAPVPLSFPRDHGSHPDAPVEWWYWTGHLSDAAGRAYGFQLTFFRAGDLALAHFGWTDLARRKFEYREKAHLVLPGIAEFAEGRLAVANEDWSAAADAAGIHRLRMASEGRSVELALAPAKPSLPQGDRGFSRKGPGANEYSHYVSIPLLTARGTLVEGGGARTPVSGTAWFDHEWGPGALPEGARGWDWFAVQLDDATELMLYRIRGRDGAATPFSSGVFVPASGSPVRLAWSDVRFRSTGEWRSPASGARYPSGWEIGVPKAGLELRIDPLLPDQELSTEQSTGVVY